MVWIFLQSEGIYKELPSNTTFQTFNLSKISEDSLLVLSIYVSDVSMYLLQTFGKKNSKKFFIFSPFSPSFSLTSDIWISIIDELKTFTIMQKLKKDIIGINHSICNFSITIWHGILREICHRKSIIQFWRWLALRRTKHWGKDAFFYGVGKVIIIS